MYEREGGLRLCECGHPMGFHPSLPAWYGAKHSDGPRCSFCDCVNPREGEFQGMRWRQSESSLK